MVHLGPLNHLDPLPPTVEQLRAAGIEAHMHRLMDELEHTVRRTWHGRLAWRLASWYARWRTRHARTR